MRGVPLELTKQQIFLALAKDVPQDGKMVPNPYQKWSDIDPSLPDQKIEVMGPPPTSGTRDAFVELAMEGGAKTFPMLAEPSRAKTRTPSRPSPTPSVKTAATSKPARTTI